MHKLSNPMPDFWRNAVAIALVTLVAACGGGGGGGGGGGVLPISSKVLVEDAAIVGATVTDSFGLTAVNTGRGEYKFLDGNDREFTPSLPITVASRNKFTNGTIEPGSPVTFQDLDRNGVFSAGDIAFNGTFTVRYAVPGASTIYANPVAGLIPASWDGNSSIAGLSPTLLKSAVNSSVETNGSEQLKQVTALLTALSDTLGSTLSSNSMSNSQVSTTLAGLLVAVSTTAGVNLLDANAATKLGEAAASTVTGTAATSALNLGTNLQKLSTAVAGTLQNQEALVQVAQNSPSLSSNTYDVSAGAQLTVNTDVTIQKARAVAVDPLRLVPFCDLIAGQTGACDSSLVGPWLAFSRLSDFRATSDVDGSIVVTGSGALFSSFSFPSGLKAKYQSNSNSWKYTQPTSASSLEITLGVSFKDSNGVGQTGNLMAICDSQGKCVPYYLSTAGGVCNLVTTSGVVDQNLLSKINAMNAQKTTCPATQ